MNLRTLALLLVVLGGLAVALWPRADGPPVVEVELPEFDRAQMSTPVRRLVDEAVAQVERQPRDAEAWGHLGSALDAHTFYEAALVAYGEASRLAPHDYRWPYLEGVVHYFLGSEIERIAERFAESERREPLYAPRFVRLGEALAAQGEADRAEAAYRRALELDPDFILARRGLGQVLLTLGRPEEALEELLYANRLNGEDATVHVALATAYQRLGRAVLAEEASTRAQLLEPVLSLPDPVRYTVDELALDPASLDRRLEEGIASGDVARAQAALAVLEELHPERGSYALRNGMCLLQLGRLQEARAAFERAAALGGLHGHAQARLADLAQDVDGDPAAALPLRRRAVELGPEEAGHHAALALTLAMTGAFEEALRSFERSDALAPGSAELHHNWGTTLQRLGRVPEATVHFETVLRLEPDSSGTLFNLGSIREEEGRREEAVALYRRSARVDPQGPAAARLAELGLALD